jgi:multicomponent Na+:H+ antiporter subunit D
VPYTANHVVFQLQLLLFSGLAFFLLLGWLKRTLTITLDVDWFWRGLGTRIARYLNRWLGVAWARVAQAATDAVLAFVVRLHGYHGPESILARTWPTGIMAFWTTLMLAAYLILAYF